MLQPTRPVFWRFVLLMTFLFVLLAIWNLIGLAERLNVQISTRPSWFGAVFALGLFGAILLVGLAAGFSKASEGLWGWFELPSVIFPKQIGIIIVLAALIGFSIITTLGRFKRIL